LRLGEFRNITIFELDLESTQTIKKALTRRLMGRLPDHVRYVSINFAQDIITETLTRAGFDPNLPSLFIWEGVTLFLNREIIAHTLGRLAEYTAHSRVIFDFVPPELIDDETDYMGNRKLLKLCASIKEPLTFGSRPGSMRALLTRLGYDNIDIVGLPDTLQRYTGSNKIEDSYFFATAETRRGGNGSNGDGESGLIHRVN
jgi:methyltransferase (TIGR00027 family)